MCYKNVFRRITTALFLEKGLLGFCSQEGKLTSYLLNTTRYSGKFRPVRSDGHAVNVKHSLILRRIVKLVSCRKNSRPGQTASRFASTRVRFLLNADVNELSWQTISTPSHLGLYDLRRRR